MGGRSKVGTTFLTPASGVDLVCTCVCIWHHVIVSAWYSLLANKCRPSCSKQNEPPCHKVRVRLGRIIPVFPPIILSFDSPKTTHYSHNLVPIILELFSIRAAKDAQQWPHFDVGGVNVIRITLHTGSIELLVPLLAAIRTRTSKLFM